MKETKKILYKLKNVNEKINKLAEEKKENLNWFEIQENNKKYDILNNQSKEIFKELVESLNGDKIKSCVLMFAVKCLPESAIDEILTWKEISKSPYSNSFYSSKNIDWDYKPIGSYRISDHWNFGNSKHCQLANTDEYTQKLMLAKFNGEKYEIIKEF